jgi:hypothetical protein
VIQWKWLSSCDLVRLYLIIIKKAQITSPYRRLIVIRKIQESLTKFNTKVSIREERARQLLLPATTGADGGGGGDQGPCGQNNCSTCMSFPTLDSFRILTLSGVRCFATMSHVIQPQTLCWKPDLTTQKVTNVFITGSVATEVMFASYFSPAVQIHTWRLRARIWSKSVLKQHT